MVPRIFLLCQLKDTNAEAEVPLDLQLKSLSSRLSTPRSKAEVSKQRPKACELKDEDAIVQCFTRAGEHSRCKVMASRSECR